MTAEPLNLAGAEDKMKCWFSVFTSWIGFCVHHSKLHTSSSPANLVHFQHSHGHLSRSSADSLLHMCGTNFALYFFKLTPSSFIFSSGMRKDSQLLTPTHLFHIIHDFAALLYSSWYFSFPNWNILAYEVVPHTKSTLWLDSTSCPSLKIFQFCYMYILKMRSELCCIHNVDEPQIYTVKSSYYYV